MTEKKTQLMIQISYLFLAYFALFMFVQAQWMLRNTFASLKSTFITIDLILLAFLLIDTGYFIYRERKRSQTLKNEAINQEKQEQVTQEKDQIEAEEEQFFYSLFNSSAPIWVTVEPVLLGVTSITWSATLSNSLLCVTIII